MIIKVRLKLKTIVLYLCDIKCELNILPDIVCLENLFKKKRFKMITVIIMMMIIKLKYIHSKLVVNVLNSKTENVVIFLSCWSFYIPYNQKLVEILIKALHSEFAP